MPKSKSKAKSLSSSQVRKVLKQCLLMQNAELKRVVIALSFSTLRVSELAQVLVQASSMETSIALTL